jgi:hypothetical protein
MADGTHQPIEKVTPGDRVLATDPETGHTSAETVTATITGSGDKTLVDITVQADDTGTGEAATITATDKHPIWVTNRGHHGSWTDAADLNPGDQLLTPDGSRVRVTAIHAYNTTATVHNLTVTTHHTYYVIAGTTPILAHNCGETPTDLFAFGNASGPRAPREGVDFYVGDDGMVVPQSGRSPHGASTFGDPMQAPLTGPYHVIPAGTQLPRGFGVVADGIDVLPGSMQPPTHHTIFPTEPIMPQDFINGFLDLPWTRAGKR